MSVQPLNRRHAIVLAAALAASVPSLSLAQAKIKVAGIYTVPFEQQWAGRLHTALKAAEARGEIEYKASENVSNADYERVMREYATAGNTLIVGEAFAVEAAARKVAKDFPKVSFLMGSSGKPQAPNFSVFDNYIQEPAYLTGMIAGGMSKSGKIGFVGGQDIPLVRKFQCGYEQGAKYVNPKVQSLYAMTGSTNAAWTDPARGAELTKAQIAQGVDVVFSAAGSTGFGIMQAAKDGGILAIGVDSNQNHLHPGTMLTSMVKRVDVAVYNLAKKTTPGVSSLGLKEGGVDYALDQHNEKLISADMKKKVDAAKADIIAGKIKVADYMADNACKY